MVAPAIGWLNATMHGVFKAISVAVESLPGAAETVLLALPGPVMAGVVIALVLWRQGTRMAALAAGCMAVAGLSGLWTATMQTVALVSVSAAIALMNRHLEDTLEMRDLAQATGYSRRHLERLFRDATGQTPGALYRALRLDRGRNLLATTDMTLVEIATACGFASAANFSRSFSARFGEPPTRLRRGIGMQG